MTSAGALAPDTGAAALDTYPTAAAKQHVNRQGQALVLGFDVLAQGALTGSEALCGQLRHAITQPALPLAGDLLPIRWTPNTPCTVPVDGMMRLNLPVGTK